MASDEPSNPTSPSYSHSDDESSSGSPSPLPEALALGREKRATAGNKLRALLDAEFQEEEIFKEDEDDEEFERQMSDNAEEFLSSSESSDENEDQQDEEAGEKALIAEQKSLSKKRKRKEAFVKPSAKRRAPAAPKGPGILTSKPTSTASSVSNRRISFDPAFLASRRSSRALTMQTTNETQSRIISAAARRATLPIVPRREQTPPLTQEERLAQAVLTEEENKMSLKRIVEAEEERVRKRKEKLEALRRRQFHEPIIRFISTRKSLIEEIPDDNEEDVIIDDEGEDSAMEVKKEINDASNVNHNAKEDAKEQGAEESRAIKDLTGDVTKSEKLDVEQTALADKDKKDGEREGSPVGISSRHSEQDEKEVQMRETLPTSAEPVPGDESMDVEEREEDHANQSTEFKDEPHGSSDPAETTGDGTTGQKKATDDPNTESNLDDTQRTNDSPAVATEGLANDANSSPSIPTSPAQPHISHTQPAPKSPPPYYEAYCTANTISFIPLPNATLQSTRETFFPSVPLIPPPKPKPSARCPITGLQARYKDPLSGVGYYDIHAFKILREVGRKGSRYVWCSEGGWFVGETGWGGRGAKGVPEGWNG